VGGQTQHSTSVTSKILWATII